MARALSLLLRVVGGGCVVAGLAMVGASAQGHGPVDGSTVGLLLALGAPLLLAGRVLDRRRTG